MENSYIIPNGTLLYRAQPVNHTSINQLFDTDTGKTGVYFSDGIFIPLGMILEYGKQMNICVYQLTSDISLSFGKYESGLYDHIDNRPWPIYGDVFCDNVWRNIVGESEIFLHSNIQHVQYIKTIGVIGTEKALSLIMYKWEMLKLEDHIRSLQHQISLKRPDIGNDLNAFF